MVTLRSCFPMLPHCLPAGNSGQQHLPDGSSPQRPCQQHLPDGSSPQRLCQQHLPDGALRQCRHPLRHGTPGQQLRYGAPASNSSVTAPPASSIFPMALRYGAPASNKPHPAEKSTPVWLAIWHTWAGFANSQLRCANFSALIYIYICVHPHCCHLGLLLRQTQIFRPICTDCLRHLRISAR